MQARSFSLVKQSSLRNLEEAVQRESVHWAGDWFNSPEEPIARAERAWERRPRDATGSCEVIAASRSGEAWVGVLSRDACFGAIAKLLFAGISGPTGLSGTSALVSDVVQACCRDLALRLASLGQIPIDLEPGSRVAIDPGEVWHKGSGAIVVELSLMGERLLWVMSPGLVSRAIPAKSSPAPHRPLEARRAVLAHQELMLSVKAGGVEVELGALQSLCVGDVLVLDASFDQPMTVSTEFGARLCSGFLGTSRGNKAVVLSR